MNQQEQVEFWNRKARAERALREVVADRRRADNARLDLWHEFKGQVERAVAGTKLELVLVLREAPPDVGQKAVTPDGADAGLGVLVACDGSEAIVTLRSVGRDVDGSHVTKGGLSWRAEDVELVEPPAIPHELARLGPPDHLDMVLLCATERLTHAVTNGECDGRALRCDVQVRIEQAFDVRGESREALDAPRVVGPAEEKELPF